MSNFIPNCVQLKGKKVIEIMILGMNERYQRTISEQLKKRARPEKISEQGKESSHCGSSDYTAPPLY